MSIDMQSIGSAPRLTEHDRARLRDIAAPVARAARVLLKQNRTTLPAEELEAFGMLAVWRKLPTYDPARATLDRWAFYQALRAMLDVARGERKETAFEAAIQRGVHGVTTQDGRRAERDLDNDTHETDVGRLHARTRRIAAGAWVQTALEQQEAGAPVERSLAAVEAVRAVHEEVARLSDEQRTCLRLRFWDDTEVKEAAEQMGISERTLRRRWVEVRDLLDARLRGRGIFGVPEGFGGAVDALEAAEEASR